MAIGDIGSIIKSLTYDPTFSYFPRIVHAAGDIYLIANGQDIASPFYVRSVSIDSLGNIGAGDYLQLATSSGGAGGIVHVNGDVYAVAFIAGPFLNMKAVVKTFTCDSAGNIGAAEIDNIDLSPSGVAPSSLPHIIHVSGNVFAVAYSDNVDDGWLKTITINDDGFIDDTPLSSWEFNATEGTQPFILHCGGTLYALIYSGPANEGYLKTFSIADNGTIDPGIVVQLNIDPEFHGGMILPLAGDNYAIFYQAADFDGWVTTVNFDGTALPTQTGTWEFTTYGAWPMAVLVSDNLAGNGKVFCVLHGTYGDYNNLATIEVLNNGTITESLIDEAQIDAVRVGTGGIVHITGDIYAAAYRGDGNDGLLKTFPVETKPLVVIPSVSIDPATSVEEETAIGNGNITDNGGEDCDKRGICWNTTGNPTVEDNKSEETDSFGTGAFSRPITGLSPGTKYYAKAYAHNSAGYGYSSEESFTTKPNAPSNLACVVQSSSQIDVNWIKGTGATKTMVRRKVGSYPNDVTDGDQAYYGTGNSFNDTSLVRATHYYYRAWSWVEGSDIWSDDYAEDNAWTLIGVPTATTDAATGLAAVLATLNGTLDSDGGEPCQCGFEWGLDTDYGVITPTETKTAVDTFSQVIGGLFPNTTYHFRALATNSAGTGHGADRSFTTALVISRSYALAREEL